MKSRSAKGQGTLLLFPPPHFDPSEKTDQEDAGKHKELLAEETDQYWDYVCLLEYLCLTLIMFSFDGNIGRIRQA